MNYVYILTNTTHTVLYIGVTSNLPRRLYEHKHELVDGFTKTYHVHELMYAEPHSDIRTAIAREKQLKFSAVSHRTLYRCARKIPRLRSG